MAFWQRSAYPDASVRFVPSNRQGLVAASIARLFQIANQAGQASGARRYDILLAIIGPSRTLGAPLEIARIREIRAKALCQGIDSRRCTSNF